MVVRPDRLKPAAKCQCEGAFCSGLSFYARGLCGCLLSISATNPSLAVSDNNTLFFLHRDGAQTGPFTIGQLRSMWQSGSITAQTQYWFEGAAEWRPLINILALLEPETALTKPMPSPQQRPPSNRIVPSRRPVSVNVQDIGVKKAVTFLCFLAVFLVVIGAVIWAVESSKQEEAKKAEKRAKLDQELSQLRRENKNKEIEIAVKRAQLRGE